MNAHNLFDAAAGFGGYRESGFGRDGGKEGLVSKQLWRCVIGGRDVFACCILVRVRETSVAAARTSVVDVPDREANVARLDARASGCCRRQATKASVQSKRMTMKTTTMMIWRRCVIDDRALALVWIARTKCTLAANRNVRTVTIRAQSTHQTARWSAVRCACSVHSISFSHTFSCRGGRWQSQRHSWRRGGSTQSSRRLVCIVFVDDEGVCGWCWRRGVLVCRGRRAAHNRAQICYFIAENLMARYDEFAQRLVDQTGVSLEVCIGSSLFVLFVWLICFFLKKIECSKRSGYVCATFVSLCRLRW